MSSSPSHVIDHDPPPIAIPRSSISDGGSSGGGCGGNDNYSWGEVSSLSSLSKDAYFFRLLFRSNPISLLLQPRRHPTHTPRLLLLTSSLTIDPSTEADRSILHLLPFLPLPVASIACLASPPLPPSPYSCVYVFKGTHCPTSPPLQSSAASIHS